MQYFVMVTIVWSLLFLAYSLFYKRSSLFTTNRIYLIGSMLIGIILPVLPRWPIANPLSKIIAPNILTQRLNEVVISANKISRSPITILVDVLPVIYFSLMLFALVHLIISIYRINKLVHGQSQLINNRRVVFINQDIVPFSFFNRIVIPVRIINETDNLHLVIDHESRHIQYGHQYDLMMIAILQIIFPFHPMLFLYRRELRQIHEYQVDRTMLNEYSAERYVDTLMAISQKKFSNLLLTNSFIHSPLKSRIMMFYKKTTTFQSAMYYLMPLIALLVYSCTSAGVSPIDTTIKKFIWADTVTVYDPETSIETMKIIKEEFDYYESPTIKAEFPGGETAMMKYIGQNLNYPADMRNDGIQGKALIQLVITEKGVVYLKNIDTKLPSSAKNAIYNLLNKMPPWKPAKVNGKEVASMVEVPITFSLH